MFFSDACYNSTYDELADQDSYKVKDEIAGEGWKTTIVIEVKDEIAGRIWWYMWCVISLSIFCWLHSICSFDDTHQYMYFSLYTCRSFMFYVFATALEVVESCSGLQGYAVHTAMLLHFVLHVAQHHRDSPLGALLTECTWSTSFHWLCDLMSEYVFVFVL